MSEMQERPPSSVESSSGMSITEVWITAVTQPNEEAYGRIANDPGGSMGKGMGFLLGAWAVSFIVSAVLQSLVTMVMSLINGGSGDAVGAAFGSLITTICAAPFAGAIGALVFIGLNFITQMIATAMGGKGTFDKLIWTISAFAVPMVLINLVLAAPSAIPFLGILFACLALGVSLYSLYLNVLTVKVVHQLEWMQAAIASLAVPLALLCLCAVLFACLTVIMGPVIGNVFSNIQGGLVP